ncbi:flagellar basal body-associated FliL family protein [Nitratireductor soli]|uniref:flagellar basal body-associated FliL family protein n=1 Tax=Nitratireductor soli TaxID=1670619 RepID=UPI001FCD1892|nr:flagellar basal body-associated FliL family protein [Nitratireductor soli]
MVQVLLLVGLTALTAGTGWFAGGYLQGRAGGEAGEPLAAESGGGNKEDGKPHGMPGVLDIQAITTNLAEPSDVWVRAELSLVFDGMPDPAVAEAVHQDLFAYIRTVRLRQVETASGFQHFRSDLEERARIRSDGAVDKILFRALLFE